MLLKVSDIKWLGRHRLRVRFTDGSSGVHDFEGMVAEPGELMEPLRQPDYFSRVFLEYGALTWPNGFDIDPKWLREEMKAAGEIDAASSIQSKRSSYHVVPSGEGRWAVKRMDAARPSGLFDSQSEAIARARDLARNGKSELVIYGKDGRVRDRTSYDSDPAPTKREARRA